MTGLLNATVVHTLMLSLTFGPAIPTPPPDAQEDGVGWFVAHYVFLVVAWFNMGHALYQIIVGAYVRRRSASPVRTAFAPHQRALDARRLRRCTRP